MILPIFGMYYKFCYLGYKKHNILSNIGIIHVINGIEGEYFPEELQEFIKNEKMNISIIAL